MEHVKKSRYPVAVGDTIMTKTGLATVIEYGGGEHCLVQFDGGFQLKTTTTHFRYGEIKNPYFKLVAGVGCIGEFDSHRDYKVHDKVYRIWQRMLKRCYTRDNTNRSYEDCTVDERWHNFQDFYKWFKDSVYQDGWHLDKDILIKGNRVYGPDTCVFVPREINSFFVKGRSIRGLLPIGVTLSKGRFMAQCKANGKRIGLGSFDSVEQAFYAYKAAKECLAHEMAAKYDRTVDPRVIDRLLKFEVELYD